MRIKDAILTAYTNGSVENIVAPESIEAAKAALAEAKTKCPDVYAKATVEGLKFFHADTPTWQKLISIWIESMKAVGIVIKPTAVEPSKYYPTVQNEETDYDISRGAWGPDWPNASTMIPELFLTTGGFNLTRNGDDPAYKQFETDTKAALNELDRKAQGKKWQALNQFLVDQLWSIPGTFTKAQDLWGSKVGNAYRWSSSGSFLFGELYVKQ
jgi:peptide/nickel transport system substrate-binding protein